MVGYKMMTRANDGREIHMVTQVSKCDYARVMSYQAPRREFNHNFFTSGVIFRLTEGFMRVFNCSKFACSPLAVFSAYASTETLSEELLEDFMKMTGSTQAEESYVTRKLADYYRELDANQCNPEQEEDDEDVTVQ